MTSEETISGFRNCPSCGAALQVSLADQFFCEYCGSPLGEEEQQAVLPDWLRDVSGEGDEGADDDLSWPESVAGPARSGGPAPTRIELRPTRAARVRSGADQPQSGISCALVLGILFFLAALCLLGWVLFAVVRQRASEPASSLTPRCLGAMSANQSWQRSRVRAREGQAASYRYQGGLGEGWDFSTAREPMVWVCCPNEVASEVDQAMGRLVRKVGKEDASVHVPPV